MSGLCLLFFLKSPTFWVGARFSKLATELFLATTLRSFSILVCPLGVRVGSEASLLRSC